MVKIKINGIENDVQEGVTILQACEEAGLEIPRFCYHENLSIAGLSLEVVRLKVHPKPKT